MASTKRVGRDFAAYRCTTLLSDFARAGGLVAVIRVSNLKDFRVSADDILGAGRRDNIPTIVTDGVSVPVHGLSISFSEITITAADVDQVVTDFKTHLGVEWESFLPDERISPIVDPATEQRESRPWRSSLCLLFSLASHRRDDWPAACTCRIGTCHSWLARPR